MLKTKKTVTATDLNDSIKYMTEFIKEEHTIAEIIMEAKVRNPSIPVHIIGSDIPLHIAIELYCKDIDMSIRIPKKSTDFFKIKMR